MSIYSRIFSLVLSLTAVCGCADKGPTSLMFERQMIEIHPGESQTIAPVFSPVGTSAGLKWYSDDSKVATVSQKGEISGVSIGQTRIHALAGDLNASVIVNVVQRASAGTEKAFQFRVMQFNILQSTSEAAGHEWATVRRQPSVAMIKDKDPDIICLQEARKTQCSNLAEDLPAYGQVLHPKDNITSNGGQRNAILYKKDKFEVVDWDKYWFSVDETSSGLRFCPEGVTNSTSQTTQKMTLWVRFREKETRKEFLVFTTHFFANVDVIDQRTKCVELSVRHVRQIPEGIPVLFCGDLNIDYTSADGRNLLKPMFEVMRSAAVSANTHDDPYTCTYNHWGTSTKVLDYIFYRDADALTYSVVNSKSYGTDYVSDHYPLISDIVVYK